MPDIIANATPLTSTILPAIIGAAGALLVFFLRELADRNRKRTELLKDKLEKFCFGLAEIQNNLVTESITPANIWNLQSNRLAGELNKVEGLVILYFPDLESEFKELFELVHLHRHEMQEVGDKLAPYLETEQEALDIYNTTAKVRLQNSVKSVGDAIRKIRNKIRAEKYDLTKEDGIHY